jgi:SpoVK/Ycf46/Vps4 family AAA+-type ATPase
MSLEYVLLAAKTMAEKGEKEYNNNLPAFSYSFKTAAKKYREAATLDPSKRNQYIALAEQYEEKAGQALGRSSSSNAQGNAGTRNTNNNSNVNRGSNNAPRGGSGNGSGRENESNKRESSLSHVEPVQEDVTVEEAMAKLNGLVGLNSVKEKVQSWVSQVRVFQKRQALGLPVPDGFSYHLVFTGNPGTGKTTVARFMAQIYKGLGILEGGQLVETQSRDLVAGYVGQTAEKTQEVIDKALGGVLFVDEAYTLNAKGNSFGQEAIDTLLKGMEDHRNELVVIVAGYTDLMEQFLDSNPGLKSRFNTVLEFQDYNGDEMIRIFDGLCKKNCYTMTPGSRSMLQQYFSDMFAHRDKNFGNGRTVRNVFQQVVLKQSERLDSLTKRNPTADIGEAELTSITEADIFNVIGGSMPKMSPEYEQMKSEASEAAIYQAITQNNIAGAALLLCRRLESLLKNVYHFSGDLCEMINAIKTQCPDKAAQLGKAGFDCLHKIRTYRNAHVHSTASDCVVTARDIAECVDVIKTLEMMA